MASYDEVEDEARLPRSNPVSLVLKTPGIALWKHSLSTRVSIETPQKKGFFLLVFIFKQPVTFV